MDSDPKFRTRGGRELSASAERPPFDETTARELAEICGLSDPSDLSSLQSQLNDLANVARSVQTEPSIRDQKASLKSLEDQGREFLMHIQDADLITRNNVFSVYPNVRLDHEVDSAIDSHSVFLRDIAHLERLCDGLKNALDSLPASGRRPSLEMMSGIAALVPLCRDLISLYESFSCESFTYDRQGSGADQDSFITAGSRFVARAAKCALPDATDPNIHTAIKRARR